MNEFSLPVELCQVFVDGILKGYKEYIGVRKKAQKDLEVSGAYAWVKGNHIDSSVCEECSKYSHVKSLVDKAGYTWEYIQFVLNNEQEKYLLIVKSSQGIANTFNEKTGRNKKENYLYDYAGINNAIINSKNIQLKKSKDFVQLELSLPELEAINKNIAIKAPEGYTRFYVVTYEVDEQSKMISKIALTLPNQDKMSLVEVADLTELIEKSEYSIGEEELEFIKGDKVPDGVYPDETHSFGYEFVAENQEDII
ncbi:hypothetical protein [Ligilactobacillus faecis]|uniref:spr1630 family ClpXP-sensitive toxin n=1 Tax=Ligilactobacillus faecis TaxID=762833 RepID=UPI002468AF5C|nr:hypothetical protein [Ligilactobacillus faecis]WGN89565.1 hypothetical protein QFX10_00200 [Ligilactobacillus faecis]